MYPPYTKYFGTVSRMCFGNHKFRRPRLQSLACLRLHSMLIPFDSMCSVIGNLNLSARALTFLNSLHNMHMRSMISLGP